VDFFIYPWRNGDIEVSNFSSILSNRLNDMLSSSGLTLGNCTQNSVESNWYVDLQIDGDIIIQELFYTGYGLTDVPTNDDWRNALILYLPNLYDYGFNYLLDGSFLTITSLTCTERNFGETLTLNSGINISINCTPNKKDISNGIIQL
jgi:hypothetical protein